MGNKLEQFKKNNAESAAGGERPITVPELWFKKILIENFEKYQRLY